MEIQELFERYELFCKKTREGEHGATNKYWMFHIEMIYQIFGITKFFENGIISIRRTKKPFSWILIDLTVAQTIKKDSRSASSGN